MRYESLSSVLDELRQSGYDIEQVSMDQWRVSHPEMAGTPLGSGMVCTLDEISILIEIQRTGVSQVERMLIIQEGDLLRRRDNALAILKRLDVTVKPLGEGRWQISDPDGFTAHFADHGVADIQSIIRLADAVEDRYLDMLKQQIVAKMYELQVNEEVDLL